MLAFIRKILVIAAVAASAYGFVLAISAWIFHIDDRQPSHSRIVGTLAIDLPEGHGLGTAVLVDPCGILTTFHSVFGPWYVTAIRPPSHEFAATFTLTEVSLPNGTHPAARATPVVWGDYRGPDRQMRSPGNDWVYLVLDRCLGAKYGYFSLRTLEPEDIEAGADNFVAIGYSSGRQMIDPTCAIRTGLGSKHAGTWLHDCALQAGDSGGPIVKHGTTTLVALGSGFVTAAGEQSCAVGDDAVRFGWDDRCANLAVQLSGEIIDHVRAAEIAAGVQRALLQLGYNAGPLGSVDEPKARAAIEQFQRSVGLDVTGEATDSLWMILLLQLYMG